MSPAGDYGNTPADLPGFYMEERLCRKSLPHWIRSNRRTTAFDVYLPKMVVKVLDILADLAVCVLGIIMLVVGWNYATTLGGRGFYVSMPWLSRFWMYFPVPLAGVAMIIFEIEAIYNHIKSIFVKEEV